MRILITGAGGLVGSEAVLYFSKQGHEVLGIDNNMREYFFGKESSVEPRLQELKQTVKSFKNININIANSLRVKDVVRQFLPDVLIHTAAQPSHDFAASYPMLDFQVNALGTLNLLEAVRLFVPNCIFVHTSTNKVYGNTPNSLNLIEYESRYDLDKEDWYYEGIDEMMSIDNTLHSIFGVSKAAADLLVQEYGRYFGVPSVCFRCGCITGPAHRGAELHGFLSYLAKCVKHDFPYTVYGYRGKQVRDNIHAYDLVKAFDEFIKNPKQNRVYNIGGGRDNSCSVREAIKMCESIEGKSFKPMLVDEARIGDHKWWISSNESFQLEYPGWKQDYNLNTTIREVYDAV
jgi:CDP-paratose 2-epimerase